MAVQTRERILDAAEALFFRDGIAVTGVDAVAESAGVAIATLYAHFGSKDGLLVAVLERRQRAWAECWERAVEAAGTSRDRLLALFDALAEFRASASETQWCCFLATASERPRRTVETEDPVQRLVDQDTSHLTIRLTALATDAGVLDAGATASDLLLIYNGALASLLRGQPDDPLVAARRIAAQVVDSG